MLDVDGTTCKGSDQLNFASVEEIVLLSSKAVVRLLLNLKHNVAGLNAGSLVTFAAELDLGAASNTPVDMDVENLSVNRCLLAVALLAAILVLDDFSFTIAVWADSLEALDHGAHLAHHGLHTSTIAACALADGTVLSSEAVTLGADDGPLQGKLGNLASVDILEGDLVRVVNGTSLGRATVLHTTEHASHATEAATAKELSKQVFSGHAARTTCATL